MDSGAHEPVIAHLGASVRIARKRRGLRILDLAHTARCSQDTLRRLENGDPGVSLGVLARVMAALGSAQKLASLMDPAEDADGLQADVRRLPQRVRLPLLPVEGISQEQLRADKRARQSASHDRVSSGEISQSALFSFRGEQLQGARFKWPASGFSPSADESDLEEHPASALKR